MITLIVLTIRNTTCIVSRNQRIQDIYERKLQHK